MTQFRLGQDVMRGDANSTVVPANAGTHTPRPFG